MASFAPHRSGPAVAGVAALSLLLADAPAGGQTVVRSEGGPLAVTTLTTGLAHAWGMAFLPDGRLLVTERPGRLRLVGRDGQLSEPLAGVPRVHARGQGGLLDVVLAPDFGTSRHVYLSYSEPGEGGSSTAVARGRLDGDRLADVRVVFSQRPRIDDSKHYGSRLVFARDGKLFVTTGDRDQFEPAQDLGSHIGKVLRINADGSVPGDNPFTGRAGVRPEIWSYGHRNIQGAALHPETGVLWLHEMGPRGGDELNIVRKGANYGWPLVSWGRHYSGRDIPDPSTRPDLADAIRQWTPVIAPSGMAFYTGELFAGWKGNILIGGLRSRGLVRLEIAGETVTHEERIALGARIRDVEVGPDGAVYVSTDEHDGKIWRLAPEGR